MRYALLLAALALACAADPVLLPDASPPADAGPCGGACGAGTVCEGGACVAVDAGAVEAGVVDSSADVVDAPAGDGDANVSVDDAGVDDAGVDARVAMDAGDDAGSGVDATDDRMAVPDRPDAPRDTGCPTGQTFCGEFCVSPGLCFPAGCVATNSLVRCGSCTTTCYANPDGSTVSCYQGRCVSP